MSNSNNTQWPFLPTDDRPYFFHPQPDTNAAPTYTAPWIYADRQPRKRRRSDEDEQPVEPTKQEKCEDEWQCYTNAEYLARTARQTRKVRVTPELREHENAGRFRISDIGDHIVPWVAERLPAVGRVLSFPLAYAENWWVAGRHERLAKEAADPEKECKHTGEARRTEVRAWRETERQRVENCKYQATVEDVSDESSDDDNMRNVVPTPHTGHESRESDNEDSSSSSDDESDDGGPKRPRGFWPGNDRKRRKSSHSSSDSEDDSSPPRRPDAVLLPAYLIPAQVPRSNASTTTTRRGPTPGRPSSTSAFTQNFAAGPKTTSSSPMLSPQLPLSPKSPWASSEYKPTKTSTAWKKIILQSKELNPTTRYPSPFTRPLGRPTASSKATTQPSKPPAVVDQPLEPTQSAYSKNHGRIHELLISTVPPTDEPVSTTPAPPLSIPRATESFPKSNAVPKSPATKKSAFGQWFPSSLLRNMITPKSSQGKSDASPLLKSSLNSNLGNSILEKKVQPADLPRHSRAYVEDTWTCPKCTLDNPVGTSACEACPYVASGQSSSDPETSSGPANTSPETQSSESHGAHQTADYVEGSGVCPACTRQNSPNASSCDTCGHFSTLRCPFCGTYNVVGAPFCVGSACHAIFEQLLPLAPAPRSTATSVQQVEHADDADGLVTYIGAPPTEDSEEFVMTGAAGPADTLDEHGNHPFVSQQEREAVLDRQSLSNATRQHRAAAATGQANHQPYFDVLPVVDAETLDRNIKEAQAKSRAELNHNRFDARMAEAETRRIIDEEADENTFLQWLLTTRRIVRDAGLPFPDSLPGWAQVNHERQQFMYDAITFQDAQEAKRKDEEELRRMVTDLSNLRQERGSEFPACLMLDGLSEERLVLVARAMSVLEEQDKMSESMDDEDEF